MSALPLLFTYRRGPYAMRARMALLQVGVAYQAHEVLIPISASVMASFK